MKSQFNLLFDTEVQLLLSFQKKKNVTKITRCPVLLTERRLMRIKGLSQEVTSKDMLRTLSQAKKECWDRFLQEKFEAECYVEGHDADER